MAILNWDFHFYMIKNFIELISIPRIRAIIVLVILFVPAVLQFLFKKLGT